MGKDSWCDLFGYEGRECFAMAGLGYPHTYDLFVINLPFILHPLSDPAEFLVLLLC